MQNFVALEFTATERLAPIRFIATSRYRSGRRLRAFDVLSAMPALMRDARRDERRPTSNFVFFGEATAEAQYISP